MIHISTGRVYAAKTKYHTSCGIIVRTNEIELPAIGAQADCMECLRKEYHREIEKMLTHALKADKRSEQIFAIEHQQDDQPEEEE